MSFTKTGLGVCAPIGDWESVLPLGTQDYDLPVAKVMLYDFHDLEYKSYLDFERSLNPHGRI